MRSMQNILSDLASVFLTEIRNYRKLLQILYKEQKILLENKISKLANFVDKEREIIYQIEDCEKERDKLIEQVSEMTGIPPEDIVFTKLIDLADEPLAQSFSEMASDIKQIAREFKTVSQCNQDLINSHRGYIRFIVELISKYDTPGRTYSQDGTIQKRESMSLFDRQV